MEQRRKNATVLMNGLKQFEKYLILPEIHKNCSPSWFGFLISVRDDAPFTKQEMVEYLESNGIGTRQLFAGNILRQPMITNADFDLRIGSDALKNSKQLSESDYAKLPGTEFIMNHTFWIGCAQNLVEKDVQKTVNTIANFIQGKIK